MKKKEPESLFSTLLVANRGEIACRIIGTARRLGIATVAVYSEADADAPHTRLADRAIAIGPAPAAESYLNIDRILDAVRQSGADAVHPGYGFLSENPAFAARLAEAGVTFVGPPAAVIASMGDKIESKKIAAEAGVNIIPGHSSPVRDPEEAVRIARGIGYPVMLKAAAGGGGKGMRLVRDDDACRAGLAAAISESRNAFGDDRVFVEKFIENPHHVEIQIIADGLGNVVWLGERDCTIQRRHQKVLEESPSPFLTAETRRRMGEQAVALARQVGYRSAGTVEFVVDGEQNFYFLEMNTRLQVEHPVTELVTGLDLVELMLRVAAGQPLPLRQDQVKCQGWAVEARLYAEDPERDFLPGSGRLSLYRPPAMGADAGNVFGNARVRLDDGVVEGTAIPVFYDPMIGKLITHAADRATALDALRAALDRFCVRGIPSNLLFLNQLCGHPAVREGRFTTAFLAQEFPQGLTPDLLTPPDPAPFLAMAALLYARLAEARQAVADRPAPQAARTDLSLFHGRDGQAESEAAVTLTAEGAAVTVDGRRLEIRLRGGWRPGLPLAEATIDGNEAAFQVEVGEGGDLLRLSGGGRRLDVRPLERRLAPLARRMPPPKKPDTARFLLSPMPGILVRLLAAPGDAVKAGQPLAVVEAMKMENVLQAQHDGVVETLHAAGGDSLLVDQPILEFRVPEKR